jgi:hypothetical protein
MSGIPVIIGFGAFLIFSIWIMLRLARKVDRMMKIG